MIFELARILRILGFQDHGVDVNTVFKRFLDFRDKLARDRR
jgi:hypothetical protein